MNCILEFENLRNRYFVMRHGRSLANERGIVVSRPENGCHGFGLGAEGRAQVAASLERCSALDAETRILSSDFSRALESAYIAFEMLACRRPPCLEQRLRERDFGAWELGSSEAYENVWLEDAKNPEQASDGVESAASVMRRMTSLVAELESTCSGETLLLVSHGDPLQLLQTAFAKQPASRHRRLTHLETAEIRQLQLA